MNGRLMTPTLSSGCLAGITRGLVLEWCAGREEDVPLAVLSEADEVFLTSATREVQPVHAVDARRLATVPGPMTARCMEIYARRSAENPEP
jgi:branched-chain amino acid aminotransferase